MGKVQEILMGKPTQGGRRPWGKGKGSPTHRKLKKITKPPGWIGLVYLLLRKKWICDHNDGRPIAIEWLVNYLYDLSIYEFWAQFIDIDKIGNEVSSTAQPLFYKLKPNGEWTK